MLFILGFEYGGVGNAKMEEKFSCSLDGFPSFGWLGF